MKRLRVLVHALDRTGPPVLARTFLRWLRAEHPDVEVDVVAFRGGPLLADMEELAATTVLLDHHEPWDRAHPDDRRLGELRRRAAALAPPDVELLVSVAASQCLRLLAPAPATVVWAVEQGEDLHWLDVADVPIHERATAWLAGSTGTLDELRHRLPAGTPVDLVPEFVAIGGSGDDGARQRRREALGTGPGDLLVVGAGIATHRKAPDLFLEVALACGRAGGPPTQFTWLGGEDDPLFPVVVAEARRVGLAGRFLMAPSVPDIVPWLAAADVMVHPARLDSFPLVALHAAGAATPVVGFAGAGGLEEMFGPSFCGAPYPDVVGLAAAVVGLADHEARAELAEAQRRRVRAAHDVTVAAPLLLEHLTEAGEP